jgi:hypothetical protein
MPQRHVAVLRSLLLQLESLHGVAEAQSRSQADTAAIPAQLLAIADLQRDLFHMPCCTPAELKDIVVHHKVGFLHPAPCRSDDNPL